MDVMTDAQFTKMAEDMLAETPRNPWNEMADTRGLFEMSHDAQVRYWAAWFKQQHLMGEVVKSLEAMGVPEPATKAYVLIKRLSKRGIDLNFRDNEC